MLLYLATTKSIFFYLVSNYHNIIELEVMVHRFLIQWPNTQSELSLRSGRKKIPCLGGQLTYQLNSDTRVL